MQPEPLCERLCRRAPNIGTVQRTVKQDSRTQCALHSERFLIVGNPVVSGSAAHCATTVQHCALAQSVSLCSRFRLPIGGERYAHSEPEPQRRSSVSCRCGLRAFLRSFFDATSQNAACTS